LALLLLLVKPTFASLSRRDFCFYFLIFVLYFTASAAWSEEKVATLGKAFELFIGLGIILRASRGPHALLRLDGLRRLLLLVLATLGSIVLIGYALRIPAFISPRPGIGFSTSAQAPFLSSNGLGYVSSLILLSIFAEWQFGTLRRTKALPQMLFVGAIYMTASSRTSLAIFVVGIAIAIYQKSKPGFLVFILCLAAGATIFWDKILKIILGGQDQGNLDSLSGRTVMWAAAFERWKDHPLLGYGGGAGGKYIIAHLGNASLEVLSSLHDGFLELLTGVGAIGALVVIVLLCAVTLAVYKRWKRYPLFGGVYILIIHMWITSLMSLGVLAWMTYEMFFYLILLAILDVQRRNERKSRLAARIRPVGAVLEL
jgi:O-antigen ligase